MALAILGFFPFTISTAPFSSMSEERSYSHPTNSVVGARPPSQFTGKENETLSLSGILYPQFTGGKSSLEILVKMAELGGAYTLITGNGKLKGVYVIEKIRTTDSYLFANGQARKIEFSIDLKQVGDKPASPLGVFHDLTMDILSKLL